MICKIFFIFETNTLLSSDNLQVGTQSVLRKVATCYALSPLSTSLHSNGGNFCAEEEKFRNLKQFYNKEIY